MIRVLQLIETGGIGGAEVVLFQLSRRLNPALYKVSSVVMHGGWLQRKLLEAGLDCTLMPSTRRFDIAFVRRLVSHIRHEHIDIIHAHLPDANFYACLAGRAAGVPVISTYHGLLGSLSPLGKRLKLLSVRHLSRHVVAVSNILRKELIAGAHVDPNRVSTIRNGVDWQPFDGPDTSSEVRRMLKLRPESRIVGMVGNMRPAKGYQFFVRAAHLILKARQDCEFLIVGEREPGLESELDREANSLGIRDRIHFLGARDDVHALLMIMDVFLLSSVSEGMSIATVEAMGCGTPVVVTRCGGPEELVQDGVTGLVVPPEDEFALSQATLKLLANPAVAQGMAARARAHARDEFGIERMIARYERVYGEILGSRA